jgi:phage portal protein BeeE
VSNTSRIVRERRGHPVRVPNPVDSGLRKNIGGREFLPRRDWGEIDQDHSGYSEDLFWLGDDRVPNRWNGPGTFTARDLRSGEPYDNPEDGVLPAVTRCLAVIVNSVIRTEWEIERGGEVIPLPLWVTDPMLAASSPGQTGSLSASAYRHVGQDFWATFLSYAILYGRAAFISLVGADGSPVAGSLRLINPYKAEPDKKGHWVINPRTEYAIQCDADGKFEMSGETWRITAMHGEAPCEGSIPSGVLLRHWHALKVGASVEGFVGGILETGVPSGYLKITQGNATQGTIDEVRANWDKSRNKGAGRNTAVLSSTVDYTPVQMNVESAQAEQITHLSRSSVALCFGLDPIWVGEGSSGLSYQNASDRRGDLVDLTSSSWGSSLTETLSTLLPYGQEMAVNWSTFILPNLQQLLPTVIQGFQAGIMTLHEARKFIGLPPPEAGHAMGQGATQTPAAEAILANKEK